MSQQAKFAITQQLRLLAKLYPQYKALVPDWIEEVEEMNVVLTGQPMSRVFCSIDQGYQLETEISKRTGLDPRTLKNCSTKCSMPESFEPSRRAARPMARAEREKCCTSGLSQRTPQVSAEITAELTIIVSRVTV